MTARVRLIVAAAALCAAVVLWMSTPHGGRLPEGAVRAPLAATPAPVVPVAERIPDPPSLRVDSIDAPGRVPLSATKTPEPQERPPAPKGGAIEAAYQRESRDHTSGAAESRLRAIYRSHPDADLIFRSARCTRSVCRIELRWTPESSDSYNMSLLEILNEFSKDISLFPEDGDPTHIPASMVLLVARKGHTLESLMEEERDAPER